jgi:Tfp pilus assembly protein PilX
MSKLKNIRSGLSLRKFDKKGVALFMVLATILIIIVLASIVLTIISSQSRLTHHKVSRIQAYYAALAGMNYAFDNLRKGTSTWPMPTDTPPNTTNFYTRSLPADPNLPGSVGSVTMVVAYRGATATLDGINVPGCSPCNPPDDVHLCICTKATYTYTSP